MLDVRWALSFRHFPPPKPKTKNHLHSPALLHLAFPPENSQAWLSAVRDIITPLVNVIFGAQFSSEQIPTAMLIERTMTLMEIVG
jgi:hypothetical protein